MTEQPTEKPDAPAPAAEGQESAPELSKTATGVEEETKAEDPSKPVESKQDATEGDSEMPDAPDKSVVEGDETTGAVAGKTPVTDDKNNRRKSAGGGNNRKSLNKKASKAKMTNLDAVPGKYYLVKLKGFPEWPAIIAEDSMLPETLPRPVTAQRADGTYLEPYADGGKRVQDRTYPVLFVQTNEFAWVANTALTPLTPELSEQKSKVPKMRADLKMAFDIASEQNDLEYFKGVIKEFKEFEENEAAQKAEEAAAKAAKKAAKAAAAATPKKSKSKAKGDNGAEDVEMAGGAASAKSQTKKRKAEDGTDTPQRPASGKKPKIKLTTNSTPKGANGAAAKDSVKTKSKDKKKSVSKEESPKEIAVPETPEEAFKRKQKEVLYLRYKLQRGLLSKDGQPQEDEMATMSKFIDMLEAMPQIEGSIIRETRVNKVLKGIVKLDSIPRESEFKFKSRSQELLNKWSKALATDDAPAETNGVNGTKSPAEEKKAEPAEEKADVKPDDKAAEKPEDAKDTTETKPAPAEPAKPDEPEPKADEASKQSPTVAA